MTMKKTNTRELTHEEVLQRIQRVAAGGAVKAIDAALILNCSIRTIRRLIAMEVLRVVRVTQRTVYIDRNCVEGLLKLPLPMDEVDQNYLAAKFSR